MDNVEQANITTEPMTQATCPKCGAALDVAGLPPFTDVQCPSCNATFQVPAKFGNFILLQRLGQGGMGGVYRARDTGLNREVAIKVMLKSLGDDPKFEESFQREAQAAAKLNHPNIAQIYAFGKEQGQPYIAMELVTGGSLDKLMAKEGPLDPGTVIHIGQQIARGLSDAADAGLVHGDVKPENILFDGDHNAKLVDFGLAAMLNPSNEVWGTPYYISPEKVRRMKTDFRADIYSLGGTLYHAICGVPPYDGPDATAVVKARFEGPYKPMAEVRKGITPELEAIIARMLEVDPTKRYPTYRSLLNDMDKYLKTVGPIKMEPKIQKKIVIKGSNAAIAATTGKVDANGNELPPGMTPISEIEEEEGDKHRGCKLFALIGAGVLALAGIVTGGIFWYLHYQKTAKDKSESAQIQTAQGNIRENIAKILANTRDYVDKLKGYPEEAMGYAKTAADAAVTVLGEEMRAKMLPPEPEEMPLPPEMESSVPSGSDTNAAAKAADTNSTSKATGTNATVSATTGTNATAAVAKVDISTATKALQEMQKKMAATVLKAKLKPADIKKAFEDFQSGKTKVLPAPLAAMTNEIAAAAKELALDGLLTTEKPPAGITIPDAFKGVLAKYAEGVKPAAAPKAAEASKEEKTEDPFAAAAAEPAADGAKEEEKSDLPPVIGMVRTMYDEAYAVKAAYSLAQRILAKLEEHAKDVDKYSKVTKADAEALAKLNNRLSEESKMISSDKRIFEMGRRTGMLKKSLESVQTEIESLVALKRQQKLDAEKKAKAAADAEKKRQEEAAIKEKADGEKKKVADGETAIADTLKDLDFNEARRKLRELDSEMETEDGKSALLTALERIQRLKDFHTYMSAKAAGYKSSKGWSIGASDLKTMTVGGQKITWKEIYNKRIDIFAELVMSLVVNPDAVKSMHLRDKSKLMTNASLALSLFCKETESAQKLAKKLANDAAEKFEADADEIKSLVPQFFE